MNALTNAILILRNHYFQNKKVDTIKEINNGLCVEFAEEIEDIVPFPIELISNDFFMNREDNDGWCGDEDDIWCEQTIQEYGSAAPFEAKELTQAVKGYHLWIFHENRHYDAECPDGVNNLFDLPFFKRELAQYNFRKV